MKQEADVSTDANKGFGTLGLHAKLVQTLTELGYEEPTPIQREAIGPLLTGRDVIGQAATGTGKTAAFALPMVQRIFDLGEDRAMPSALVLVPTRELAMQVAEAMHKYGAKLKISVIPIYGGHSFGQQARMLERGVDIVVATPGRAVDHIRRKTLDLTGLAILALDEADEMLDMGFADDLEAILSETPAERQTVFFSATLPPRISGMVKRHMKDPIRLQIASEPIAKGAAPKVRQTAYIVPRGKKLEALGRVLDMEDPTSALVFCRTRLEVDNLTERLGAQGYRAQALHGGIEQDQRTRVIKKLREGKIDLVIATDVAARGLDIENLALVVNYDVPTTPESYLHRIGRVGRAGREGVAITLADPRESRLLRQFELQTKAKIGLAQVPTVADLRARRLELTRAALREMILAGDLDHYRVAVESLAQEHDLMDIALAAVKLAHQASGGDGEKDEGPARPTMPAAKSTAPRVATAAAAPPPSAVPALDRKDAKDVLQIPMSRIYIGIGRLAGVLPQNLVGAITGGGIKGNLLGTVEISEKYSLVEVPEQLLEEVVRQMQHTLIKGKKVVVRRFVEKPGVPRKP
ncbi:MAG TPA: DEAD/DEAH box helicase [Tepidisphaeraceae bacterium]|jgi:ATP-dependent RNA helicase DeaD|nr:DEAD/DEAH box helicase [Tepidisphaeraceae bacterium]